MNNESLSAWDRIIALPTWITINLIYPFLPKNHLYKKYKTTPTLENWIKSRTPVYTLFDIVIWSLINILFIVLINIYFKYISQL